MAINFREESLKLLEKVQPSTMVGLKTMTIGICTLTGAGILGAIGGYEKLAGNSLFFGVSPETMQVGSVVIGAFGLFMMIAGLGDIMRDYHTD